MKCIDIAFYLSRMIPMFPLHDFTPVSPGQQSSRTWRHTTSIMKGRIFSSGTEKCVFPAFFMTVCTFLLYCSSRRAELLLSYCPQHLIGVTTPNMHSYVGLCFDGSLCFNRKRGSWSSRACWISSGVFDDQSGFRCRTTTSVSVHRPPLRPGTRVVIWTVKGKLSRRVRFRLDAWKW